MNGIQNCGLTILSERDTFWLSIIHNTNFDDYQVTEEEAEKLFQEELKAMEESEKSDDHQSDKATHTCSPVTDSQMV